MSKRKPKIFYNYDRLKRYCDENSIDLTKDYSKGKINRETIIEANCLNCSGEVKKNFCMFLKNGCLCRKCMLKERGLKIKETLLNIGFTRDYLKLIKEKIDIYNCTDVSIDGKPISEYLSTDIHSKLYINFTCNCGEKQSKHVYSFVDLDNGDAYGGKCRKCMLKERGLKMKQTKLNNGSAIDYLELIKEKIDIYNCTDVSIDGKPISEYQSRNINRRLDINFTCNCGEKQSKHVYSFVDLDNGDAYGGKCEKCMLKERALKTKQSKLNNGSAIDYLELIKEKIDIYNCTDVSIDGKPISEYQSRNINRRLDINFTCNCGEKQSKQVYSFVELYNGDADGGKCEKCIRKEQVLKTKETRLNNGSAIDYLELIKEKIDIYNCTDVSIDGKPISEYQSRNINRRLDINFTCNCGEKQSKHVASFVELISDAEGGKCEKCIKIKTLDKIKTTFLERYGVEHPMQNAEIFEKVQKAGFQRKEYTFPSGRIVSVQGYEPQALDYFIKNGGKEDDIITDTDEIESKCGKIFYHFEDERHRYYPDFYLISTHKIIEVKSTYTFENEKDKNLKKREACLNLEINFEFWIMDEKGNLLNII